MSKEQNHAAIKEIKMKSFVHRGIGEMYKGHQGNAAPVQEQNTLFEIHKLEGNKMSSANLVSRKWNN